MSDGSQIRKVLFDNLKSGLTTKSMLDADPPATRVEWMAWDSGFRGTGLQIGDQIVAIDGDAIARAPDLPTLQRLNRELPGGLNESDVFKAKGLKDGSALRLKVRRRRVPGEGWETLEITGNVRTERAYHYPTGRRALGPTGPDTLANDGFDGPWSSWYEKRIFDWTRVLDGGWQSRLNSRKALEDHLEEKPRVDFVVKNCPGPFADTLLADWEAVRVSLEGRRYELAPGALDFRELEEERAKQVSAAGAQAWKAFLAQRAADMLAAGTKVDPIRGDRAHVTGKLVALPAISPRQWVVSIGRNFLSSEQNGAWYFVPTDTPVMRRVFFAMQRYKRHVSPSLREDIAVIGRILPDPRMLASGGRGVAGFDVEPLAVLVGNAMFVDLSVVHDDASPFAGEDKLKKLSAGLPADDATPRQVLEALIAALKAGDQEVWNQLFVDWRFVPDATKPIYYPFYPYPSGSRDEDWIRARRNVLGKICDVRVLWVDAPRVLQRGDEYEGAPRIEQVHAEIEHIGEFDGAYRAFNSSEVNRLWTLQRRNGGPWRIATFQAI